MKYSMQKAAKHRGACPINALYAIVKMRQKRIYGCLPSPAYSVCNESSQWGTDRLTCSVDEREVALPDPPLSQRHHIAE